VRYGVISDIHSNFQALEAVLRALDTQAIDQLACLGDIVGYGPNPNECCALIRERAGITISGNHDEAAVSGAGKERFNKLAREALRWTQSTLTPENHAFLSQLPREAWLGDVSLVHGAPVRHFEYIIDVLDAQRAFTHTEAPVTLVGHSHVAEVFYQDAHGRTYGQKLKAGGRVDVLPQFRYIINVGSVGQPRDFNPQASFGLWDDAQRVFEVQRVDYDISTVQERIQNAKLPAELGARLTLGC
jgi:diadenosine tetraphosphatase ApaH/serine/threonine PP2A family protein phosphatase